MNAAEITLVPSPLLDPPELDLINDEPVVAETADIEASSPGLSEETESGLLRFARFLKRSAKSKENKRGLEYKRFKAIQTYESIQNFSAASLGGQVLDKYL